ncbi:hypothetical protein GOP47_0025365 [Adiantum capillus-veneris]|uniref:Uncharacterized protein n=1 Tax=Adiantum capillus-veneris TaxID=13818 RepID=A0A9D4U077_ADICA|nr:hypothetical protein GOP47_0025365 [Adiantum capillus-veneris]
MIKVVNQPEEDDAVTEIIVGVNKLHLQEEVSIRDVQVEQEKKESGEESEVEEEDHRNQTFYDASDELDEFEDNEEEPIQMLMRSGKVVEIPVKSNELVKRRRRQRQSLSRG